ncbi:hypothetical protein Golomagni_04488 [Golovinomyces magnicellulatus]|nr:hypothetical protein Golomagni_04488 [Golovinomyces magnicellulatus]
MSSLSKAIPVLRNLTYWPFVAITWLPAVILFKAHGGEITQVTGESMYPTLNANFNENLKKDICWIKKWRATDGLKRGMVVTARNPLNPETLQVKRIAALEGDTVITRAPCPVSSIQIPVNHVWLEGDNKDASKTLDSNTYGPIPINLIQGKVTYILLPLQRFGRLRWWEYSINSRVSEGQGNCAPGWF